MGWCGVVWTGLIRLRLGSKQHNTRNASAVTEFQRLQKLTTTTAAAAATVTTTTAATTTVAAGAAGRNYYCHYYYINITNWPSHLPCKL
jgi:hypothetical protein